MKRENNLNVAFLPEAREVYEAPVIETVEVRVEKGFQVSGSDGLDPPGDDESW